MLKGPLIIPNPNRRHCCPCPHRQGPHWGTIPPRVNGNMYGPTGRPSVRTEVKGHYGCTEHHV